MNLSQFYEKVVRLGAERDPRPHKDKIRSYGDTAILHGDLETKVKKILLGIDIEVAELLLADRIREREGLDLVVSHHPEGSAYARLHEVMQVQVDVLEKIGVKREIAQKLLEERQQEVQRKILPQNHTRPVDAARILGLPFMCMHTPADNHAFSFIKGFLEREKPKTVQDIVYLLEEVPEYRHAQRYNCGPRIIIGNPRRAVGKVLVEMTGGTEGPKDVFDKLYKVGVRTLVSMHLSEEHFKKVKDANLNVVIAGHISSDNLGINLLLDRVEREEKEKFQVISCSGFYRISRN
jgi:putative NIF3 family GTP cyclohydrolase 1 type 2